MSDLAPKVVNRLTKELMDLQSSPCEGIRVAINETNIGDIQAEMDGPVDTPYHGGLFRIQLVIPSEFPEAPPKGLFLTRIFHPNVSTSGDICVNVLKKDWTSDMGIRHVLMIVRCLLIQPFPDSALNEEAGRLLQDNYEEYAKHARLMTSIHAQPPKRAAPTPLTASGANATSNTYATGDKPAAGEQAAGGLAAEGGSPLKKAKAEAVGKPAVPAAASKVKKNLRRL